MTQDVDIVEDIFSRVKQILGDEFKGDIAIKLKNEEDNVRQSWGGERPYIAAVKKKREKAKENALCDLNKGKSIEEAVKKNGISRAGIYRLLNKK